MDQPEISVSAQYSLRLTGLESADLYCVVHGSLIDAGQEIAHPGVRCWYYSKENIRIAVG